MVDSSSTRFRPVKHILNQVTRLFLARRNVVACGMGYKIRDGVQTDEPSLIVSVTRKIPAGELSVGDLIPKAIDGVTTDVIETGEIRPLGFNRMIPSRPLRPGVSIGHQDGTAGTAGCYVRRGDEWFILSNNHVLALLNTAREGDSILQPGPRDGGTLSDAVGELAEYVPLRFLEVKDNEGMSQADKPEEEPQGCARFLASLSRALSRINTPGPDFPTPLEDALPENLADAALMRPFSSVTLDPNIIDIGSPPNGTASPELGLQVIKSGRSTGLTQGRIVQVDVTVDVTYSAGKVARFRDQIMVTPFSQAGDSGSLVMNFERQAVGLLFSGSEMISVVNPISSVLRMLNVDLLTIG